MAIMEKVKFCLCLLCAVWLTGPAYASLSTSFYDMLLSWMYGVAYVLIFVALIVSFGLGLWAFLRTMAAFGVLALLDMSTMGRLEDGFFDIVVVVPTLFVLFVLGGAWLGWALFNEVVRPARTSFVVWPRCGWLHRAHALWLGLALLFAFLGFLYVVWDEWVEPIFQEQPVETMGNDLIY